MKYFSVVEMLPTAYHIKFCCDLITVKSERSSIVQAKNTQLRHEIDHKSLLSTHCHEESLKLALLQSYCGRRATGTLFN